MLSIAGQKLPITLAPKIIARELESARVHKEEEPAIADYFYEQVEAALHALAGHKKIEPPSFYEKKHYIRSARAPDTPELKKLQQSIADVHFERGEVLSRLNRWGEAKAQYQKAYKWGHPSAQEQLRVSAQLPIRPSSPLGSFRGLHRVTPSSGSTVSTLSAVYSPTPAPIVEETPAFKFFLKNLPLIPPALPQAGQPLRNTQQLGYCLLLLHLDQQEPASVAKLNAEESAWLTRVKQDQDDQELRLLAEDVIRAFDKDELKNAAVVAEVSALAPVYARDDFQKLLNTLITQLTTLTLLDFDLLYGVVQMIRSAPPHSLRTDDLVKILDNVGTRLKETDAQSGENQYRLVLAVCQVLDAMADNQVTDLNREALHQPLKDFFNGLKQSTDPYLVYQAEYASQALAYVPDDETPWQGAWRRVSGVIGGVSKFVSATKAFDVNGFVDGLKDLQKPISELMQFASDTYEQVNALKENGQALMESLKEGFSFDRKHVWYPMLRGFDEMPSAQLAEFKQQLMQPELKACRSHKTFLWGLSERLGRIAAHPEQNADTRSQALAWLGELYEDDQTWGQHPLIQQRVVRLIRMLADDSPVKDAANTLLARLKTVGAAAQQTFYQDTCLTEPLSPFPLYEARPQPISLSLLDKVQHKQSLEPMLRQLKAQCLARWHDTLYVPPQGKASLFASDTETFDLAEKAETFFHSDKKVALVLGESGAGKSTFLRFLEVTLWDRYQKGGRIPLFIALPAIDNPEQDFITKHLRRLGLTQAQIKTLKEHRQFIVIGDGYDESGSNDNLYEGNRLNQPGEWQGQLIVGCRSQHLDDHYRQRFQPANPALFEEWVAAPFGKAQVDQYVQAYVDHQHREMVDGQSDLLYWEVSDYQRALEQIDENFTRTPLLLKTALGVLPRLLRLEKQDTTSLTRAMLYDESMKERFAREKQRLQGEELTDDLESAFNVLDEEGFVQHCMQFVTTLAVAVYEKNQGNPVVEYNPFTDKGTWKEAFFSEAPRTRVLRKTWPLIRSGHQYRFEHKSFLEYFVTRDICQPQEAESAVLAKREDGRPGVKSRRGSDASLLSFESQPERLDANPIEAAPLPDSLLTRLNLIKEPAIIQFLAERVSTEPNFKQQLHAFIERSKIDLTMRKAAANAMTILIKARVSFLGTDLTGIQIPGADLSYGVFDAVQLQGADLRKVNLTGTWLRATDFSRARMEGVQFGELPSLRFEGGVSACCYSPDRRYFVAAVGGWGEPGKMVLHDAQTLAPLHTFEEHTDQVVSVTFSGDGHMLASGSEDHTVRLWSVAEKKALHTFDGHTHAVSSVTFSGDGQTLASGSLDQTVRLWSVAEKKALHTFDEHTSSVNSVTFSGDGQTLASGSGDNTVRLWSVAEKKALHTFDGHTGWVTSVTFSGDGQMLASGSEDQTVILWSVAEKKALHTFDGHTNWVSSVTFSGNGQTLASGSWDGTVRLWSVAEKKALHTFDGHIHFVSSVTFSGDGQTLASGSLDQTVRLWSVAEKKALHTFDGHTSSVGSVTFSGDGQTLASGSGDCTVMLWSVAEKKALHTFDGHTAWVSSVTFSSDGQTLASGSEDQTVMLWSVAEKRVLHTFDGHNGWVTNVAFSGDGQTLASGSEDQTVMLWSVAEKKALHTFDGHTSSVSSVTFSGDGQTLASGSKDQTVMLWSVAEKKALHTFDGHTHLVSSVTFSSDGQTLASGSWDNTVRLWSVAEKKALHTFDGHTDSVKSVTFSGDGQILASGSDDQTVRLWSISGECLAVIRGFNGAVNSVAWQTTVEGEWLLTGSEDNAVRLWQVHREGQQCRVALCWTSTQRALMAPDMCIQDVVGLNTINTQLLKQRGATGEPRQALEKKSAAKACGKLRDM